MSSLSGKGADQSAHACDPAALNRALLHGKAVLCVQSNAASAAPLTWADTDWLGGGSHRCVHVRSCKQGQTVSCQHKQQEQVCTAMPCCSAMMWCHVVVWCGVV